MHLTAAERLIVALDVPTVDEALRAVKTLDNVSFFKIGLQLFITGGLPALLDELRGKQGKRIFVDLKVPGDISNTIAAVVDFCVERGVTFLTVSDSMPRRALAAAKGARDAKGRQEPKLLTVPFVSSLDAADLPPGARDDDVESFIVARARAALEAGCDGVIASGDAIRVCRAAFPGTIIVSPGIRPAGSSHDDHKRFTTPAEAIALGADYLVVGRPIMKDPDPRAAARRVLDEIEAASRTPATS